MYYTLIYDDYDNELVALAVSTKYVAEDIQGFIKNIKLESEDVLSYKEIFKRFPDDIKVVLATTDIESVFI